ncbi:Nicotinate-nucleotide adenylyltransferase [Buchnera aphidicola (Brachycaudus tragopogonis)]
MKKLHAIFGGNFDPIHYGHIYSAEKLAQRLSIEKIILLPNNNPPHRAQTKTSIIDKINMIKLAVYDNSLFEVSYLEIERKHVFFTVDTLKKIRKKIGFLQSLCFIIGEDNLQSFNLWKDWKKILLYSHLLICPRKYKKKNYSLTQWINSHITRDANILHQKPFGYIFFSDIETINISSSQIRENYFSGKSSYGLLPPMVHKYIILKKLYYNQL